MSASQIVFYAFAVVLIGSALRVITAPNPVHAVLSLVLAFFTSGALWLFFGAEFLAIALVLVYVGAVMVLFLFVVMMVDINAEKLRQEFRASLPLAAVVGSIIVVEMLALISRVADTPVGVNIQQGAASTMENVSNTRMLGEEIFTYHLVAFEFAGMILLVAMVAAIAITMDKVQIIRRQVPGEQVQVRKDERLRIVKMKAEGDVEM